MNLICRLCLSREDSTSYIGLFSPEAIDQMLVEKIHSLLRIQINSEDSHPKQICLECLARIQDFASFSERCQLHQDVFELQHSIGAKRDNSSEPPQDDSEGSDVEISEENKIETVPEEEAPANQSQEFPKVLIKDTHLAVKGRELSRLLSKFYRLDCEVCQSKEQTFKDVYSLFGHYKNVHKTRGHVTCCGTRFYKSRLMALHMARHLQPEAFKCDDCGKLMTCPKILKYHKQNHLPEQDRPLACKECPRRFSYNSALIAHMVSHLPEEKKPSFECGECNKAFASSARLSSHILQLHAERADLVCHICAKQFSTKGNLTYHLRTHQPHDHQVQCPKCGKWLRNKVCLKKHQLQHSGDTHKCDLCPYSAVNIQCLRNHMNTKHSSAKPYVCSVCQMGFKLKTTLNSHMAQHTGQKRFTCEFCSRQFASSGNYYGHRKRMHAEQVERQKRTKEEEEALRRTKIKQ